MICLVAEERHKWRNAIERLRKSNRISELELLEFRKKADESMLEIVKKCEDAASHIVTTIENQMRQALLVKVEELIGSDPILNVYR
jgi:hypothetical protein